MKQPFKHFDLPTIHLDESSGEDYIPPQTRDHSERERRHELPTGSILLEQQRSGLKIAKHIVDFNFEDPHERAFAFDTITPSLINASWYSYSRGAGDVMRRRLDLPEMASDDVEGWRQTREGLLHKIRSGMACAVDLATRLEAAHKKGLTTERLRRQFGRYSGSLALAMSMYDLGNAPESMSAYDIQAVARLRSLDTLQQARQLRAHDTYASVAQLANSHSPLSIYWMQHAPSGNEAANVFAQSQEDFGTHA